MAWAANEISSSDIQRMQSNEECKAEFTIDDFKSKTENLNLPERSLELIFSRKNFDQNGAKPFTDNVLDVDAFKDAVSDAKEFKKIKDDLGVESIGKKAEMILTGDTDGRMSLDNVEGLLENNYLKKDNGKIVTTDKGNQFVDYLLTKGQFVTSDKHVVDHVKDFEKNQFNDKYGQSFKEEFAEEIQYIKANAVQWKDEDGYISKNKLQKMAKTEVDQTSKNDFDGDNIKNYDDFDDDNKASKAAQFLLDNEEYMNGKTTQAGYDVKDDKVNLNALYESDGDIGTRTLQSKIGNCFALAGLSALASSDEGSSLIANSLTQKDNGDYEVVFPNDPEQQKYVVTQEEVNSSEVTRLGSDMDMNIMNLAIDKYLKANAHKAAEYTFQKEYVGVELPSEDSPDYKPIQAAIDARAAQIEKAGVGSGGAPKMIMELFTDNVGLSVKTASLSEAGASHDVNFDWFVDNAEAINSNAKVVTIGAKADINPNKSERNWKPQADGGNHAFVLESVDTENETIQLTNPWNTGRKLTMTKDEYNELVRNIDGLHLSYADFNQTNNV